MVLMVRKTKISYQCANLLEKFEQKSIKEYG